MLSPGFESTVFVSSFREWWGFQGLMEQMVFR